MEVLDQIEGSHIIIQGPEYIFWWIIGFIYALVAV